jgi:hypothetical protein
MPIQLIEEVASHDDERGDCTKPSLAFVGSVLFGAAGDDDLTLGLEGDFHGAAEKSREVAEASRHSLRGLQLRGNVFTTRQ